MSPTVQDDKNDVSDKNNDGNNDKIIDNHGAANIGGVNKSGGKQKKKTTIGDVKSVVNSDAILRKVRQAAKGSGVEKPPSAPATS